MSEETHQKPRFDQGTWVRLFDLGTWVRLCNEGKLENRCVAHPTYRGIRKPRVECEACEFLYRGKNASL